MPKVAIARSQRLLLHRRSELALACDLIAPTRPFGDTHVKRGRGRRGMSQRLGRLVGVSRARELSYTARTFSGTDAAAWGLAVRSVPLAELDAAVTELASAIAANSPAALAAYKDLYARSLDTGLAEGLAYEAATRYPIDDTEERVGSFR
jgi:enoyl-CoA hydratase/carnithine racemase